MENGALSEEQLKRIEENRRNALEKFKERHERLVKQKFESKTDTSQPYQEEGSEQYIKISESTGKPALKVSSKSTKLSLSGHSRKERIVFQMYSEGCFSTTSCSSLSEIYRNIPGASFIVEESLWRFPLSQYEVLLSKMGSRKPSNDNVIPKSVLSLFSQSPPAKMSFDLKSLDSCLVDSLYPFQREGIEMALNRMGRIILADDMGLGKSIQALGIALYYRLEWPLLIITPASMVTSWYEQVLRWIPSVPAEAVQVAYDSKVNLSGIVNVTSYDLAVKLLPICSVQFKVIIADECHALKNKDSKRSKILVPFLKAAGRSILLSGTPALSRPMELFPQIQAVAPKLFPKHFEFGKRYCDGQKTYFGWDFKGSSNLRELQLVLERTIMIRRTKDSVLSQLPRKLRHQIFLKVNDKELNTFKKLNELRGNISAIDDEALDEVQKKAEYMALWKRTAEIKLPSILEYIDDLLEAGHKMLIFAHHQCILDSLESHIIGHGIRSIRIDGKTPTHTRQDLCNEFQIVSSIRCAILSITAASTGLTLTAATTVIFAELFWNPGVLVQAEDRAHRIGQTDSVNVHYLLAKGTSDDNIWPLILKKLTLLESVGLGKNDFDVISKLEHDPHQLRLDRFFGTKRKLNENPE